MGNEPEDELIETTDDRYTIRIFERRYHSFTPNGEQLDVDGNVVLESSWSTYFYEIGDANRAIRLHRRKNPPLPVNVASIPSVQTMSEASEPMGLSHDVATFLGIQVSKEIKDVLGAGWEEVDDGDVFGVTLGDGTAYFLVVTETYQDVAQGGVVALNGDDNLIAANKAITAFLTEHGIVFSEPIGSQRFIVHHLS